MVSDCKGCFFYDEEQDEFRQKYNDVIVIGEDLDEQHFCGAFEPIPAGVFEGERSCPKYLPK